MKNDADCSLPHDRIRYRTVKLFGPERFSLLLKACRTNRSHNDSTCDARSCQSGANGSVNSVWLVCKIDQGGADLALFPPQVVVEVKALACQMPDELGLPFSRLSTRDIAREALNRGIVASISGTTVWRWLSQDAIKPWSYRSWISPRDPAFAQKANRVLDLYAKQWDNQPLGPHDYVICADEKTSIQARRRLERTPPMPGQLRRVESDYERKGALAYLAAWDVHRAKVFGICVSRTGIDAHHQLVDHVMTQEPYSSAHRVFWITDNGSSHRGEASVQRLAQWYGNAIQIHTPVHASWLNQIEIYFSIVQKKALTPNEFESLQAVQDRLLQFQEFYEGLARPFDWTFTKQDLARLLDKMTLTTSATVESAA